MIALQTEFFSYKRKERVRIIMGSSVRDLSQSEHPDYIVGDIFTFEVDEEFSNSRIFHLGWHEDGGQPTYFAYRTL